MRFFFVDTFGSSRQSIAANMGDHQRQTQLLAPSDGADTTYGGLCAARTMQRSALDRAADRTGRSAARSLRPRTDVTFAHMIAGYPGVRQNPWSYPPQLLCGGTKHTICEAEGLQGLREQNQGRGRSILFLFAHEALLAANLRDRHDTRAVQDLVAVDCFCSSTFHYWRHFSNQNESVTVSAPVRSSRPHSDGATAIPRGRRAQVRGRSTRCALRVSCLC